MCSTGYSQVAGAAGSEGCAVIYLIPAYYVHYVQQTKQSLGEAKKQGLEPLVKGSSIEARYFWFPLLLLLPQLTVLLQSLLYLL